VDLYERPVERVRRQKENSREGKTEERKRRFTFYL
jgi:hypothetical protein